MTNTAPTTGAADLPEALRVPLDSLHADAGYLCGRLLNGSLTQEQVVESIRRRIDAAKLAAITAQAISAEPAEHVQNPAENEHVAGDVSGNGAGLNMSTPHARITELESQLAQRFDAADMATASAQGFRDGVASLTAQAADRAIENCPELNMGNYDEVDVERLNDWAIRANDEIDRLHALAAGQATAAPAQPAAQAVVQDDLITLRKPTTSAELLWLLKLAHLVISDVDKTLEETFAPAQPAAQQPQGVAYAALPEPYCNAHDDADACYPDMFSEHQMRAFADATHALRASHGQAPAGAGMGHTDGGRNMFYEGRFDGESQREQQARLRWANDMRAAFERHTGNGWFDKDWRTETGLWSSAWHACLAAQPSPTAQAASVQEDAARESEYRRGYRHGYEQRDAEVRGAMA